MRSIIKNKVNKKICQDKCLKISQRLTLKVVVNKIMLQLQQHLVQIIILNLLRSQKRFNLMHKQGEPYQYKIQMKWSNNSNLFLLKTLEFLQSLQVVLILIKINSNLTYSKRISYRNKILVLIKPSNQKCFYQIILKKLKSIYQYALSNKIQVSWKKKMKIAKMLSKRMKIYSYMMIIRHQEQAHNNLILIS